MWYCFSQLCLKNQVVYQLRLSIKFTRLYSSSSLHDVVKDMMANLQLHQKEARQSHMLRKEKLRKYNAGVIQAYVLGSGAVGAPKALYLFTDNSRYLFNCGEGCQRLAIEHKLKLSKLEHVFVTNPSWENIGGLPGVALSIQEVGIPELTVHGPPGLDVIFSAASRFVILNHLCIRTTDYTQSDVFEDNALTVRYVPLFRDLKNDNHKNSSDSKIIKDKAASPVYSQSDNEESREESDSDTDYYSYLKPSTSEKKSPKNKNSSKRSQSEMRKSSNSVSPKVNPISMSYICSTQPLQGKLNIEACVDFNVPAGPLFGKLKKGEDVTLPDGTVVRSQDVRDPDSPGIVFIVVDCPTEEFLEALIKEPSFLKYQSGEAEEIASLIIHFSPCHVIENPKYREWMNQFPKETKHLVVNDGNICLGSTAVHRMQQKLNLLHPTIFPLLPNTGFPVVLDDEVKNPEGEILSLVKLPISKTSESAVNHLKYVVEHLETSRSSSIYSDKDSTILEGRTLACFSLRPHLGNFEKPLSLYPKVYLNEAFCEEEFDNKLSKLKREIEELKPSVESNKLNEYPKVLFLGTGCSIPNKVRNTSGILVHVDDNSSFLLDCGENTYGQIVRFYGREKAEKVLLNLKGIYISHLHADHHLGLIGVLTGRRLAINNYLKRMSTVDKKDDQTDNLTVARFPAGVKPLHLLAPGQIMPWLVLYHRNFENILEEFKLIGNADVMSHSVSKNQLKTALVDLKLQEIKMCAVRHCSHSFGVSFVTFQGTKISYSGDTMPCDGLIEIGENSDILIHEATMDNELVELARKKKHSTVEEAISVGQKMNAKFTILTHFSQRYAHIPRFTETFPDNVGIAFDNMQVSSKDLSILPKFLPVLRIMFAEKLHEMEMQAERRELTNRWRKLNANRKRKASTSPLRSIEEAA